MIRFITRILGRLAARPQQTARVETDSHDGDTLVRLGYWRPFDEEDYRRSAPPRRRWLDRGARR